MSLIADGKFSEALESNTLNSFEQAYCLYRLNKYQQALDAIECESGLKYQHLRAQIYFRADNHEMAAQVYSEILAQTKPSDPYYMELQTNCNAVVANATASNSLLDKNIYSTNNDSFEILFNLALIRTGQMRLEEALELLEIASSSCRLELEQEGYSEQEIEKECAVILAQLGHVHQLLGHDEQARELFKSIQDAGY